MPVHAAPAKQNDSQYPAGQQRMATQKTHNRKPAVGQRQRGPPIRFNLSHLLALSGDFSQQLAAILHQFEH